MHTFKNQDFSWHTISILFHWGELTRENLTYKVTQVGGICGPQHHHGKWWDLSLRGPWCWGHWTLGLEALYPKRLGNHSKRKTCHKDGEITFAWCNCMPLNSLRGSHDNLKTEEIPKFSSMWKSSKPLDRGETPWGWRYIIYFYKTFQ